MLTKKDAQVIDNIVTKRVDEVVTKRVDEIVTKRVDEVVTKRVDEIVTKRVDEVVTKRVDEIVDNKLKPIKKTLTKIKNTLDITIKFFDRDVTRLKKRTDRIEDYLGLQHLPN